ncbi:MAG: glycosyltransferase [Candidatus Roizmanbacteria bacterium]|nr:glycosyltransferase [Candidatus Roizmanbacteria bacterium]
MHSTKKNHKIKISLIIPIFNEEKRIHNLKTLWAFVKNKSYIREIIIVNDGSTDNTKKILLDFQKTTKCVVVSYRKNKGKGWAIKKGVEVARGTHVVFIDVDLSTPPKMIGELKKIILTKDVIIGTRKNSKAILAKRQPKLRESMGKFFTVLSQTILSVHVSDFTCGFKCFSIKAAKHIFKKQQIKRWAFDSESLFLAHKYGYSIGEIPVEWKDAKGTKVRFPQDAISSFFDLLKIRITDLLGKY